jgi:hypothetical protein
MGGDSGSPARMTLDQLLASLEEQAKEESTLTVGAILDLFGGRAQGPLLVLPAFLATAPTGAIPGMSIVTGSIIILVSLQILVTPGRLSLPERLKRLEIPGDKLRRTLRIGRRAARVIDRMLVMRLNTIGKPPFSTIIALACIGMGVLMFPLALVPFAVALPGASVTVLGLAILASDGLAAVLGLALASGTAAAAWFMTGMA